MSTIGASRRSTSVRHVSGSSGSNRPQRPPAALVHGERSAAGDRINRKVLIGVGVAVLIGGVILVIVVVVGGGGGQKDGVAATPENLVACLKGDGIQDAVLSQPAPDAAGGTAAVAVVSREQDPLYGNIIEITYFGSPAEAEAYLDPSLLPTVSAQRERLADTVTADYSASYGSTGPPELESIKSCLSQ